MDGLQIEFMPDEPVPSVKTYAENGKLIVEVCDIQDGGVVYCDPQDLPPDARGAVE
jgi:hypothetical protein